jgi:antirestriction protein ArdC
MDVADADEQAKREVEAEAVAYAVGRHFGLDVSNSAFYLASWSDEPADSLRERLDRISTTAQKLIDTIEANQPSIDIGSMSSSRA